jgi:hypothetical protein
VAGMNLLGGASYGSSYGSAALPRAANPPSSTIAQQAYGISTPGAGVSKVPAYGTVALGAAGALVLVWLWYSLPR